MLAVEGVYHDGVVELKNVPQGIRRARAIVTLLEEEPDTAGGSAVNTTIRRIHELMAQVRRVPSVVDELIAERRAEARRE